MSEFVELPNGRLINKAAIRDFDPVRSHRINYINGTHELIPEEYGPALVDALKPKPTPPAPTLTGAIFGEGGPEQVVPLEKKAPRGRKKKTETTVK